MKKQGKKIEKKGQKILVLGLFTIIALGAIFLFIGTIMQPPQSLKDKNVHKLSVEENLKKFSSTEEMFFNDSLYISLIDKLILYKKETFITSDEFNQQIASVFKDYIPIFKSCCYKAFSMSVWNETEHQFMLARISEIRSFKDGANKSLVTSELNSQLSEVEKVITDYRQAKIIAKSTKFISIQDTKEKIAKADKYKRDSLLCNCVALRDALSNVKEKIANSHYRYLEAKVSELQNYYQMEENDYDALVSNVNKELGDYKNYYGENAHYNDLKHKAAEYNRNAMSYYGNNQKQINAYLNSQWERMYSSNSLYNAYRSYSNYNRHGEESTMYFTIKGYKEFTFYVRSNGEGGSDYLIVQINKSPTKEDNYANTKGKPSSEDYMKVKISDLNPTSTYTIYVTYIKDDSVNRFDDRGYVLLPTN